MTHTAYPFTFIGKTKEGADSYQIETLLYCFCSVKSGHEYEVHVESYVNHLYCLKFFDLDTSPANGKFSHTTGTYEPRTIFHTIVDIANDVLRRDNMASFLFIGAADSRDISGQATRRYRVYCTFINYINLNEQFEIVCIDRYSLCIIINRLYTVDKMSYVRSILSFIE